MIVNCHGKNAVDGSSYHRRVLMTVQELEARISRRLGAAPDVGRDLVALVEIALHIATRLEN